MSEATDIIDALSDQLEGSSYLADINRFEKYGLEMDMVRDGRFPWVNTKFGDPSMRVMNADNQRRYDYERHLYHIVITFAVRNKIKETAEENAWDIYFNIKSAILSDVTFGGTVRNEPFSPQASIDVVNFESGEYWIGRGAIVFDVYQDVYMR